MAEGNFRWIRHAIYLHTGWRRLIGSPKLQIIFHKRAVKYRSLLRKMTCKDKGSYESSPPYSNEACHMWMRRVTCEWIMSCRGCCSVLQYVNVYIRTMRCAYQCVAVCCSMLQYVNVNELCHVVGVIVNMYVNVYIRTMRCAYQCVAVCCSVLQCVAVCKCVYSYHEMCVAVCCSVLQCVAVCKCIYSYHEMCVSVSCSVLQCVAVCCSVLQYIFVPWDVRKWLRAIIQWIRHVVYLHMYTE